MRSGGSFVVAALSVLTLEIGVSQISTANEWHPSISNTGRAVFQVLRLPRKADLFQFPVASLPIPDLTFEIQVADAVGVGRVYFTPQDIGEGRPSIDASGNWVACQRGSVVTVFEPTTGSVAYQAPGIMPTISGSGRFVAFLSQDPNLHDPDGDGDPSNNQPPNPPPPGQAGWILYVHDRDADEDRNLDESAPGATWTRYVHLGYPIRHPLVSLRLSQDPVTSADPTTDLTGWLLGLSFFNGTQWELRIYDIGQLRSRTTESPDRVRGVVSSLYPLSPPSIAGSRVAFTAQGQLSSPVGPRVPAIWVFEIRADAMAPVLGVTVRGSLGAAVLSRDGRLLAFHTSSASFQRINQDPEPVPFSFGNVGDWNAIDDVYVFDLLTTQPIWSTLLLRGSGGIGLYDPCTAPALSDLTSGWIAFQQTSQTKSQVRIANFHPPTGIYR